MNYRAFAIILLIFSCTASMAQEENDTNAVYESSVLFTLPGVVAKSMYSNPSLDTFFIHSQDTLYTVTRDGTVISKDSSDIIYGCFEGENMYYLIKGEPIITGKISMKYYPAIIINQFGDTIVNFHNILKYNSSSNLNRTDSLTSRDYSFLGVNKDTFYIYDTFSRGGRSMNITSVNSKDSKFRIYCYLYVDDINGICYYNNKLFYLNSYGNYMYSYYYDKTDIIEKILLEDNTSNPKVGLIIRNDTIYSYCNSKNQLLMIEKQQVNSVQEITDSKSDGNPVYYGIDGIMNLPNESRIQIIRDSDGATKKVLKR